MYCSWEPISDEPKDSGMYLVGWSNDTGVVCVAHLRKGGRWSVRDGGYRIYPTHYLRGFVPIGTEPPAPAGKTVTPRIAVVVDPDGGWSSAGASYLPDKQAMSRATGTASRGAARYWITAPLTVPAPVEVEVEAQVEECR